MTQKRRVKLFREQLAYDFLGDWTDGEGNANIDQALLPPSRTLDMLREPHGSVPGNPLLPKPLYMTQYIERMGIGTLMMIQESIEHALPEPDFDQQPGEFVATLWRDWLTAHVLAGLNLNDLQNAVIPHLKISRQLTGETDRTAARDLEDMVKKGILNRYGDRRGTFYGKAKKMPQL